MRQIETLLITSLITTLILITFLLAVMYLPFIKVVVPPEPCGADSGATSVRDGTCLPRGQCDIRKGQRAGDCSMGFGECCRLFANCTMDASRIEIDEYVTVLRTPEPATTQCSFKIRRVMSQSSHFCRHNNCNVFGTCRKRMSAKSAWISRPFLPPLQMGMGSVKWIGYPLVTPSLFRMGLQLVAS